MIASFFNRRKKESFFSASTLQTEDAAALSCRNALMALALGDEEEGYRILIAFQKKLPRHLSAPITAKHLLAEHGQRKEPSLYMQDLSFSWLAHLHVYALENRKHAATISKVSGLISNQCIMQLASIQQQTDIFMPRTLRETYDTVLRILNIWAHYPILTTDPQITDRILEMSLKDLTSLDLKLMDKAHPLPIFAQINICMVLTIFEQTLLDMQNSSFADPYFAKLAELYGKKITSSSHPIINSWLTHIRAHRDARVDSLSSSFGSCFDEKNGVALFSRDPIVHAHIFTWFYVTHKILRQYRIVHHTLDDRLKKLCSLLSEFFIHQEEQDHQSNILKQSHLDLGFLSLQRFSQNAYNLPLIFPPNPKTLSKFFYHAKKDALYEPVEASAIGFHFAKTPKLALQFCVQTPKNQHENYLLSPLSLFVYGGRFSPKEIQGKARLNSFEETKRKHPDFPIFSHPQHPFPKNDTLSYLRQTGIGIHNTQEKLRYFDDMIENIEPLGFSDAARKSHFQEALNQYPKMPSDLYMLIAGLKLLAEDISIVRQIFCSRKKNIIFGIDKIISTSTILRQRDLHFHIGFYCTPSWQVMPTEEPYKWLLKDSRYGKRQFIFRAEHRQGKASWQMAEHRGEGGGHWLYHTQAMPSQGQIEIPWSIASPQSLRGERRIKLPQLPQLPQLG